MMEPTVSFENDIKSIFTDIDQDHMSFMFDLSSYDDVKSNADGIYDAVLNQRMPPASSDGGDGPWTQDKVDKFKAWIDGGFQP